MGRSPRYGEHQGRRITGLAPPDGPRDGYLFLGLGGVAGAGTPDSGAVTIANVEREVGVVGTDVSEVDGNSI